MRKNRARATIDFETRSEADIRATSWMYARHPSTRILCLSFVLPGWDPEDPSLWSPIPGESYFGKDGSQTLEKLFDHIRAGGLVEAHNVTFERSIWHWVATKPMGTDRDSPWCATGLGAPPLADSQLRDSAAKAATFALPRALDAAGEAMGLSILKDVEGGKLMKLLTKPRKAKKAEPKVTEDGTPLVYYRDFDIEEYRRLYTYCQQDVRSEHALSEAVPDLVESEYQVWLADMRANWRGVKVDIELVEAAIDIDRQVKKQMNAELFELTGITKGTARAQVLKWLRDRGVPLADSTAATLDWWMEHESFAGREADVQRVLSIARNINRTSVTKYVRIKQCMDPDDHRVRELVMYHGAATGRWSGKGIQVQNFPRGNLYEIYGGAITIEEACNDIKTRDLAWLQCFYTDVLSLLSSCLRGCLIPDDGKVFYVADYSAIEARVVLWLADAKNALEVFRRGEDIYCAIASVIYRRPITKKDKAERQFGKVTILGLGYGMGFLTFLLTLRSYHIHFSEAQAREIMGGKYQSRVNWVTDRLWPKMPSDDQLTPARVKSFKATQRQARADLRRLTDKRENPRAIIHELALCKYVVDTYRDEYPEVKKLWSVQEKAATDAVKLWKMEQRKAYDELRDPEVKEVRAGKVTWYVEDSFLYCRLPSGRRLVYNQPDLKYSVTPWGEKRAELRFMGVHKKIKKWARMATYGGSIVENIDQATARDMMAYALAKVSHGFDVGELQYAPLTTIHDELLAEAPDDYGSVEEFEHLLTDLPDEYAGCPVAAEGARLTRYQK